jgi:hypothetical protein
MPRHREQRWLRIVAAYIVLLLVIGGIATAIYVSIADVYQVLVIRLATALVLAIALIHIHGSLRRVVENEPPSEFDHALHPMRPPPRIDPLLLKLREELSSSVADRRDFESALWPRLVALAERCRSTGGLEKPPTGWLPRRGPSLERIAMILACLERKP